MVQNNREPVLKFIFLMNTAVVFSVELKREGIHHEYRPDRVGAGIITVNAFYDFGGHVTKIADKYRRS